MIDDTTSNELASEDEGTTSQEVAPVTPFPAPAFPASTFPDPGDSIPDTRLYVQDHEDWNISIKRDSERIYCYSKLPDQDWFHLILSGEIYLTRQHERYCLRCALRLGYLTQDRLFWQHRVPRRPHSNL